MLLLLACAIDNGVTGKDGNSEPFDTGSTLSPADTGDSVAPTDEACNGVDDNGDGEVDEGYDDFDGDGVADCVDDTCTLTAEPAGTVPTNDACSDGTTWTTPADIGNAQIEWATSGPDLMSAPIVAQLTDDNGDGGIDADDVPDILGVDYVTGELWAFAGDTGAVEWTRSLDMTPLGAAAADVDGDGQINLVLLTRTGLCATEPDGTVRWCNPDAKYSYNGGPTITDLEGDGRAEIISAPVIIDGVTGATLVSDVCTEAATFPAVGDLDGDGVKEIVCGETAYGADGTVRWTHGARDYAYAALVDVDADDKPEVLVTGWGYGIFLYRGDGSLLASAGMAGHYSAACVADLDGDGAPELAVPERTQLEVYEADLTLKWTQPAVDASGAASCSAFDFDADGAYELLYADEETLGIYDGTTGGALFTWDGHTSGTMWEYPVIADVDADGSAEVIVFESYGESSGAVAIGHTTDDWAPADPTWSQYVFDGGNVSADGEVLPDPPDPWRNGGFVHARPPGYLDPDSNTWSLDHALPDLAVAITDACVADCTDGPAQLALTVTNGGLAAGDALVVLYAVGPDGDREVARTTLTIEAGTRAEPIELTLPLADLGPYGWRATVARADGGEDCDESDNEARWSDVDCL